ncbi:hypothetical protein AN928_14965 [Pseudomonas aeruginosa]|nr:hypothetical protein T266_23615 [Pseudomonas aeruginosa VRFPA05]KZL99135.1 hypothetical protein AN929_15005 [Pseudomonas aeruginosa]RMJ34037.1 hypothetical protein BFC97_26395 [Pseudomonas aeruginosa 39016]KZM05520.1 hypothetical protein AN928_14965 [Pseudomonas aeruginosa]KZM12151.1 hypothetical protein AN930_14095 [Pseudomonas aeruginosa]
MTLRDIINFRCLPLTFALLPFTLSSRFCASFRVTGVLALRLTVIPSSEGITIQNAPLHRVDNIHDLFVCHVKRASQIFRRDSHVTARDIS